MKVDLSPLKFESFYVTEFQYEFDLKPEDSGIEIEDQPYEIDLDYIPNLNLDREFGMYIKLSVNRGKNKLPGHSIAISAGGYFRVQTGDELAETAIKNLTNLSPLTMLIGTVRSYLKLVTSNNPLGGYLLPSISVHELVKSKEKVKKRAPRKKTISK